MAVEQAEIKPIELETEASLSDEEVAEVVVPDPDLTIKHPLQNSWTLWYFKNDKTKEWSLCLKDVASFDTIEDFWALYNYIQAASKLQVGCDYSVFKTGVNPMWEDQANRQGGRWLITLDKRQRFSDLDNFWLEILLCLIGETFDDCSEQVCGAVLNVRPKGDKLAVWTANAQNMDANMKIGRKLKERLNIPRTLAIGFQAHQDTMSKAGSTAKNMYMV